MIIMSKLEGFIREGIRPIEDRDDVGTIAYINANKELKEMYEDNSLSTFISKVQVMERSLGKDSIRIKARKEAFRDLLDEYHELYHQGGDL